MCIRDRWQVLDTTWFGVPQHRERVFVVGYLGGEPPIKIFFEPNHAGEASGIQGHQVNTITRRYHGAQATGSYVVESELDAQRIEVIHRSRTQIKRIYGVNGVAPTLHRYTGGHQDVKIAIPVLTPNRLEKRQNGRRFKDNGEPAFTVTCQDRNGVFDGKIIRTLTPCLLYTSPSPRD